MPSRRGFSNWARGEPASGLVLLSGFGLITSLQLSGPLKSFQALEEDLRRLRLYSDLLRGTLLLWLRGRPAVLFLNELPCPGQHALKQLAPHSVSLAGVLTLGNCPCEAWSSWFHFNYVQE